MLSLQTKIMALLAYTLVQAWLAAAARAAEPIADTGLSLGNSATQHRGQFASEDRAVMKRFHALLHDVEDLRDALSCLKPELERAGNPLPLQGPHAEVQWLFHLALRNNPELGAMRSELAVLAARTRQAGAQSDPMAMLEIMDVPATLPLINGLGETAVSIGLSQEFQSYGKRGIEHKIASYDERLQLLDLADAELKLLWDIVQRYYELAGQAAELRAMDRKLELMEIIVEYGEKRYGLGLTPQATVLEAQLELSLMEKERVEMRTMLRQGLEELAEMLGYPDEFDAAELTYGFPYPQPQPIELEQPKLLARTLDELPEYQRLLLLAEQKGVNVELARRGYFPDYKLSASYKVGAMMQDSFTASIEVPLMLHKAERQDAALQEAYAEQRTTEDQQAVIPNRLARVLANLQSELDMHRDLAERYRTVVVPQARLTVESMLEAYASGASMQGGMPMQLDDVVMSLQTALDAENEYEQQQIHYVHVLADLQVATVGVFDPGRYMYIPAKEVTGGQGVGDSVGGLVVPNAEVAIEGTAGPDQGASAADAVTPPFVEQLELPRTDTDEPSSPEDNSGFYEPFQPQDQKP